MEVLRKICDEWGFTLAETTSLFPFVWEVIEFSLVGVTTGCEQEEHAFGEGFDSSWYFLGVFAELGDGVSSEGDTWDGVEAWSIVEHNGESSHAKDGIIDLDLSDNIIAMLFSKFDELWMRRKLLYLVAGMTSFSRMCLRLLEELKNLLAINCINKNISTQ